MMSLVSERRSVHPLAAQHRSRLSMHHALMAILVAMALACPVWVSAQNLAGTPAAAAPAPDARSGRATTTEASSPRRAVVAFLEACRSGDYAGAAQLLDLSAVATQDATATAQHGARLARRLKIVLDRTFWVNPEAISGRPEGTVEPGLAEDQERLTTLQAGSRDIDILLSRVPGAGGRPAWRIDAATVAAIDLLYDEHGFGWLGDYLPSIFFTVRLWEIVLWQWIAIAILILLGWVAARLLTPLLLTVLRRATRRTQVDWDDELVSVLAGPLRLGVLSLFLFMTSSWLHLAEPAQQGAQLVWKLLAVLIIGWLLSAWVGLGARLLEQAVSARANPVARSFIPIFARIAKLGVWSLVLVVGLDVVGVEAMGLVAGLGIGGLAVAFAAQKTIENLFGSLAIAADRPFQVGDFITAGGTSGTVEEIGLRSTRIRTMARTIVTVPNGALMAERIETFAARDRILFRTTLGLIYATTAAQLELVIDDIKKHLHAHPKTYKDTIRVRLDSLGDSAINISIITWLETTDFNEYTALVEQLYLDLLKIVERAGTSFAFPSTTVYLTREAEPLDTTVAHAAAAAAEVEVESRRLRGDLWIPEPPPPPDPGPDPEALEPPRA